MVWKKHQPEFSSTDSLQRALEIEVVQQFREQNARLMAELEQLRQSKCSPASGDSPSQSRVEIQGMEPRMGRMEGAMVWVARPQELVSKRHKGS